MKTKVWKEHELIGFEIVCVGGGVTEQMGGGINHQQKGFKTIPQEYWTKSEKKSTWRRTHKRNLGLGKNRKLRSRIE